MNRPAKLFFTMLTSMVIYAVVVGTLVPPEVNVHKYNVIEIAKLLPSGFLVALSGVLAVFMDEAAQEKRKYLFFWAIATFFALGFGMVLWVITAAAMSMSSFMILGFIPIVTFSFLIKYIWNE